jgi:hypothetical protein
MSLFTESYDPKASLRHYPMPNISRFGLNPWNENLYRIIFAPSRMNLAVDESNRARWVSTYRKLGDVWVLERWRSAWDFCQMTEEQWNYSPCAVLGPYPSRGEYEHVHDFPVHAQPADCDMEKLISWIEEGKNRTPYEKLQVAKQDLAIERKDRNELVDQVVRDKWSAYNSNDFSSALVSRKGKTANLKKTTREVGLPTQPGSLVVLK